MQSDPATRLAAVESGIVEACRRAGRTRDDVTLVAVSKRHTDDKVRALHALGQVDFGENLVQPWRQRLETLADLDPVRWHLIGPVQTKKAKLVARDRPALLHTVDRPKLVDALDKRLDAPLECLIQVNVDREPQKAGVLPAELDALADRVAACAHLVLRGVMCIPRPADDMRPTFARTRALGESIADRLAGRLELSMGMTADFDAAIAEGATLIRVGTALFGERPPP